MLPSRSLRIAVTVAVVGLLPASGRSAVPGRPGERPDSSPAVGAQASDFALPLLHSDPEQVIRLSALRDKPVALIFGSYT